MKRITLLAIALLSLTGAAASDEFTGKVATLAKATQCATGQWYALYNTAAGKFLTDNGDGSLGTSTTPALNFAHEYRGCFVTLETADGGAYYLRTGEGSYIGALSSAETATTATAEAAYTLQLTDGGTDTWTLGNSGRYLDGSLGSQASTGDATEWTLYAVTLNDEDELSASQRLTFQKKILGSGEACMVRLFCKRNTAKYLTSPESGTAEGANLLSKTDYSQIWVINPKGTGYTMRNASTGEFLTATYSTPGEETTLYIQQSPNNGTNDYYYNVSSTSGFSSNTCLNLGNDGQTLYQWSYSGDAGCDWAMEMVYEVSIDEVKEHIEESNIYATELTDGAYYRITSDAYGVTMTESSGKVKCLTIDGDNFAQYWQLTKNGSGWQIKNVLTEGFIQKQTGTSQQYTTATAATDFYITRTDDEWAYTWYIANTQGGNVGLHCDASKNVVNWTTTGVAASKWLFEEVELTEEDIEAAKEKYDEYLTVVENRSEIEAALEALFEDKACTTLKSSVASLTDEELEANADYASLPTEIKAMVTKVRDGAWGLTATGSTVTDSYEKFFRIADYKPYSHYTQMAENAYTGQSNCYGKLSGPTGLYVNSGDILYLYVDQDAGGDCTLQVEVVSTDGVPGDHQTGTTTDLSAGLNVIRAAEQDVVYIFYQLNNPEKYLADYPDIKIHIEGGNVNGCFDVTRGMTNQDWANMKELGLLNQCPVLNLKTEKLVFAMASDLVLSAMTAAHQSTGDETEDAEKLMRIWNMIVSNEESYQGLEGLEGRFRNVWNAFSVDYNYMFATSYGTYYNESTLPSVMNYYSMTHQGENNEGGSLWGPSHEIGHNHQSPIKMIGTTESSNNLFSNINMHEQGVSTTRGPSPVTNFDDYLANGSSWLDRDIWVTTRMFAQLYFYFHVMGNDTDFLPNLFKALRSDPITKGSWDSSLTADSDGDGVADVSGGYKSYGKDDYLKFAKKVCDVAQADLSEFFEAYGMFVPEKDRYCGDYSNYFVTTTQGDIESARLYMQKYEKKLGNLMFIDDHIEKKLADADNKFEAVPASDGYRVNCGTGTNYKVGTAGVFGDYEMYDGHTEYGVTNDYYSTSSNTIQFKGTGCVGHKVYDLDGNLIWATNMKSTTIPEAIRDLFPDKVVVVAAEENMSEVPCPYYRSGSYEVYRMNVNFADGVNLTWWANDNIDSYLPTNAIGVIQSSGAPEGLTSSVNVVNTDGSAQHVVIDGNVACHIPEAINASKLDFTKDGDGFQALSLPFEVKHATTISGTEYVHDATVEAGDPVVTNGAVAYSLTGAALKAGDYDVADNGYVLAADGSEVEAAEGVSPFVYLFDSAFVLGNLDSVNEILSAPDADAQVVYDLAGRRVTKVTKRGVYIINGVKTFVR